MLCICAPGASEKGNEKEHDDDEEEKGKEVEGNIHRSSVAHFSVHSGREPDTFASFLGRS